MSVQQHLRKFVEYTDIKIAWRGIRSAGNEQKDHVSAGTTLKKQYKHGFADNYLDIRRSGVESP